MHFLIVVMSFCHYCKTSLTAVNNRENEGDGGDEEMKLTECLRLILSFKKIK